MCAFQLLVVARLLLCLQDRPRAREVRGIRSTAYHRVRANPRILMPVTDERVERIEFLVLSRRFQLPASTYFEVPLTARARVFFVFSSLGPWDDRVTTSWKHPSPLRRLDRHPMPALLLASCTYVCACTRVHPHSILALKKPTQATTSPAAAPATDESETDYRPQPAPYPRDKATTSGRHGENQQQHQHQHQQWRRGRGGRGEQQTWRPRRRATNNAR